MSDSSIQSIDRAFSIIEALSNNPRGLSLTELSKEVSLHKTTTLRILSALINNGYVSKNDELKKYILTLKCFEVGSAIVTSTNVLSVAEPYLAQLSELSGEVIHLALRDNNDIVFVYKEDSTDNFVRMGSRIGLRSPMYCTGVGKAILASLSNNEILKVWRSTNIIRYTENTITSFDAFMDDVQLTRSRGYAIDNEEQEIGVRCIAAAIIDYTGNPVAAVCISASTHNMDDDRIRLLTPALLSAANNISKFYGKV